MLKFLLSAALVGLVGTLPAAAIPVINAGFESGDFTGWSRSGATVQDGVMTNGTLSGIAHSGNFGAYFGATGATSTLSQTLATTIGATYQVSYWLRNYASSATPQFFSTDFAGTTGQTFGVTGPSGYTLFSYTAVATAATSTLNFTFRNDPNFWGLDDISVDEISVGGAPELNAAGVLPMSVFASLMLGLLTSRRRQTAF